MIKSFKHAFRGITYVIRHEKNFRIHLLITFLVSTVGILFHISRYEWMILILTIMAILTLEIINTGFERLIDIVKPRLSEHIRILKDISAAFVLIGSIGAVIIGIIVFTPYIIEKFS